LTSRTAASLNAQAPHNREQRAGGAEFPENTSWNDILERQSERPCGAESLRVMGLEALKSAERAAGFAMAPVDDLVGECGDEATVRAEVGWQPGQWSHTPAVAKPAATSVASTADWLKGLFGFSSGRRAAA
jgi:hypothetical protein